MIFGSKKKPESFLQESYSQEGEDSILGRVFDDRPNGFFVDVGAHHPKRFSNTFRFYNRGWRGINIDATPGSMKPFLAERPEDTNIEIPVSDEEKELTFFIFNEPALNTFSAEIAGERETQAPYHITNRVLVKTMRLENILDQHLPPGKKIQFLTVDAEGYDFKILKSNNWIKYRPEFVLFEGDPYYNTFTGSDCFQFMLGQGYVFVAKTVSTYFFKEETKAV